jgi:hypothetical protein
MIVSQFSVRLPLSIAPHYGRPPLAEQTPVSELGFALGDSDILDVVASAGGDDGPSNGGWWRLAPFATEYAAPGEVALRHEKAKG